jgi:hypothetical protein
VRPSSGAAGWNCGASVRNIPAFLRASVAAAGTAAPACDSSAPEFFGLTNLPARIEYVSTCFSSTPVALPAPAVPSRLLAAKLARLRAKCVATAALTGVAIALGVTVELLALALFADWWLDLAWGVRLVLLFVQAGVFGFILAKFILLPILHPPDDDELALMVEKARPLFRSR